MSGELAGEDQIFIDPVLHSRKVLRMQVGVLGFLLAAVAAGVWIKWWLGGADAEGARFALMMTSAVAAGFFAGYYMMQRNRRVLMSGARLRINDDGLVWEIPGGETRVTWDDITEVRVAGRPSRGRGPDVVVRTARGNLPAFMRWCDASGPLPEPVLWSGGTRFRLPDGRENALGPESSVLVAALADRVPADKFKRGVLV